MAPISSSCGASILLGVRYEPKIVENLPMRRACGDCNNPTLAISAGFRCPGAVQVQCALNPEAKRLAKTVRLRWSHWAESPSSWRAAEQRQREAVFIVLPQKRGRRTDHRREKAKAAACCHPKVVGRPAPGTGRAHGGSCIACKGFVKYKSSLRRTSLSVERLIPTPACLFTHGSSCLVFVLVFRKRGGGRFPGHSQPTGFARPCAPCYEHVRSEQKQFPSSERASSS